MHFTSQSNANDLFSYNGGTEMEFDALFHIDDSFKLRMGSGYINTDMWVERLNIVHAAIYPLSILYMEGVNFEKNRD